MIGAEKKVVIDWVNVNEKRISDLNQQIWHYAEPAWREYRSAKTLCGVLKEEGFLVEEGTGGMPTAFLATFGDGQPVIGTCAEYDATPGISQKAATYKAPRDDGNPYAAGHIDPHSALGVAALAGIISAKKAMQKHKLKGTLKLFGEPAEKVCGSKSIHAAKGYYNDLDAFISYHPSWPWLGGNTAIWDTQMGSAWEVIFTFECINPETWMDPNVHKYMGIHDAGRCPGALDAICLMYTTSKYTKEAMFPHIGSWCVYENILTAECTSDNWPSRIGQMRYALFSPALEIQEQLYRVLENNAKHVAEITHCKLGIQWISKTRVGLTNHVMADLVYRNMELAGPPIYGEEARKNAREIQENCGQKPMEDPIDALSECLTTPQKAETINRRLLAPWQKVAGADDYVEYTWHAPTARFYTCRAGLKEYPEFKYPMWVDCAQSGMSCMIDPAIFVAAKTIGASMVELLTEPTVLKQAQGEFDERTGGGIGGSKWVAPLLPPDHKAPVDLKWPEYVTTERGRDWYIPKPS